MKLYFGGTSPGSYIDLAAGPPISFPAMAVSMCAKLVIVDLVILLSESKLAIWWFSSVDVNPRFVHHGLLVSGVLPPIVTISDLNDTPFSKH